MLPDMALIGVPGALAQAEHAGGPFQRVSPGTPRISTRTFCNFAPNARDVSVNGELDGKPHQMTKGADGVWSATVGPLPPDIYTYSFTIDGVNALDPLNTNTKLGYWSFGPVSVVELPGDGPQFY